MPQPHASADLVGTEILEDRAKVLFLDCLSLVERLHRRMLDVIKDVLDKEGKAELNPAQALLIYNIGTNEMTAGELKSRGYYLGSNVSYNLKKLVEMGYLSHERAEHDRRAVKIAVTPKGLTIQDLIDDVYHTDLDGLLDNDLLTTGHMRELRQYLRSIERFWSDKLRFSL